MLKIGQNWAKIANYPPQCSTKICTPGCDATVVILSMLRLYGIFPCLSNNITTVLIFISTTVKDSIPTLTLVHLIWLLRFFRM